MSSEGMPTEESKKKCDGRSRKGEIYAHTTECRGGIFTVKYRNEQQK